MTINELFGAGAILFVVVIAGLCLRDVLRPGTLADRSPRFLDEHQVEHTRQVEAERRDLDYFRTLRTDPRGETDRLRREHGWAREEVGS